MASAVAKEGAAADVPDGQPMLLEIRSIPSRAQVLRNGYVIGETPMQLSLQSRKTFLLQLKKAGYMASAVEVLPGDQRLVEIRLKPMETAAAAKKRGLVQGKTSPPAAKPALPKSSAAEPAGTVGAQAKPAAPTARKASPAKTTTKKTVSAKPAPVKKASKPKASPAKTAPKKTPPKKATPAKTGGDGYDLF